MFCSLDSYTLKKNHESTARVRSIRGFFTRPRVTLGKPAVQNGYQGLSVFVATHQEEVS
jgi:hypothetical protein